MIINKDTQLCISLASRPSNFGTTLHNAAYTALDINFIYKAFGISDITGAIAGVRALNIRGCSISMPFKEAVLPLLDKLDDTARIIGAVNTVVNDAGILTGFNTDAAGAQTALESINLHPNEHVLLLGAGGAARAIMFALRNIGVKKVCVSNRDPKRVQLLNSILVCETIPWEEKQLVNADVLINATSIGMTPEIELSPMNVSYLQRVRAVMDVVVSPMETRLIREARVAGKETVPGYVMSLEQTVIQFMLYTGKFPPRSLIESKLRDLLAV